MKIAHIYADTGIEDEVLSTYGEVTRVGIDPDPNPTRPDQTHRERLRETDPLPPSV